MATKIVTKNSFTASAVPTASDLVQGELAVNVTDKRLFTENNLGVVVELGTNPTSLTTGSIAVTGTVDGRDVSTDGTKLDGVATGATNVTNNNQLTNGAGYVTTDTNTTYTAGSGLSLTGTVFANTAPAQTAAQLLTAIKTVDGSGSGLDADTVDGFNISTASTGTNANTIYFRT